MDSGIFTHLQVYMGNEDGRFLEDYNPYRSFADLTCCYALKVISLILTFSNRLNEVTRTNKQRFYSRLRPIHSKGKEVIDVCDMHLEMSWDVGDYGDLKSLKGCIASFIVLFASIKAEIDSDELQPASEIVDEIIELRSVYQQRWRKHHIWILLNFYRLQNPFYELKAQPGETVKKWSVIATNRARKLLFPDQFAAYLMVKIYDT